MKIFELINNKLVQNDNSLNDIVKFYFSIGYGNFDYCFTFVHNSNSIIYLKKNNKIVGIIRALSDEKRFAVLFDLFIDRKYRKQGLGTQLVKEICRYYENMKVNYIYLTTDPSDPNLYKFYNKIGLKEARDEKVFCWPYETPINKP